MPAISIIVPIYNMEKLMRRCIDSLLAQTFTDYELLLIDDGSTDGSPAICDEYLQRDNRIRVYHKPNGGLSDARNYGLARAQGTYTIFADPDDWVSPEGLDRLYATAEREHADMTICDLYREDEYSRHYLKEQPSECKADVVLAEIFQNLGGFTVNKLILSELYKKYNVHYPIGIYGCEDDYAMSCLLMHDLKIAYEPVAFYHYMYNPTSLTRHYDENTYMMDVNILKMFDTLLQGHPAYEFAHKGKYYDIFTRAFWNGRKQFTSKSFKDKFNHYKKDVFAMQLPVFMRCMLYFSCIGFYQPANGLTLALFKAKRLLKQIIYRVR